MTGDLWEVRDFGAGLAVELRGQPPALVLTSDGQAIRVELAEARGLVAALRNAAGDPAGLLAGGGAHHA